METITLEQVYYVGEIVGIAAVVASVFYLAVQLKQNTKAVRQSTLHAVTEELRDIDSFLLSGEQPTVIFLKGLQDAQALTSHEKLSFYAMDHSCTRTFQNGFFQYVDGPLEKRHWIGVERMFTDITTQPGFRKFWADRKHWYSDEFQEYMEGVIFKAPIGDYKLAGS